LTTHQLYQELNYVNHSREKRLHYANLLLSQPDLIPKLLDILFKVDDKISCRAAWVYEFMCGANLTASLPYLEEFTSQMSKVHLDPAVRPVAKICEYLASAYYEKADDAVKRHLLPKHRERIVAVCFDWLMADGKVAPKAYAMHTLFLLGSEYDWIYPELKIILERDYPLQSSGFKARARHILKKIKHSGTQANLNQSS